MGAVIGGMGVWLAAMPAAAQQGPPPAKVVVALVTQRSVSPTDRMVGAVDFDRRSGVSSEVSGLIQEQSISEGQVVRKGDALVRLNTDFVDQDVAILRKEIEQIDIKIGNTRKNLARTQRLYRQKAASEQAYEDLLDGLRELQKEREIVQENIAKRELERAKSTIRAPYDGLVLTKHKNEGEWVSPGTPVCDIAAIDDIVVKVAVPEDLVRFVGPGVTMRLAIGALGEDLTGTVAGIVPVADPASKTFQVKIAIPYMENLIQNMSAAVQVPVAARRTLRMIPRAALVRSGNRDLVFTVEDGRAKPLPVTVVAVEGEFLGVDDPHIRTGTTVVVDGNERLRPEQAVEVIETRPAES